MAGAGGFTSALVLFEDGPLPLVFGLCRGVATGGVVVFSNGVLSAALGPAM